ncbi:MAG: hypothetical protein H7841_10065 [Magnetospirillum sp. WYHS-4]
MIRLTHEQIMTLVECDWLGAGPIRLNSNLTLAELSDAPVLPNARLLLKCMDEDGGVKLTSTGNFGQKFVARMAEEFTWPGYDREMLWRVNKVLNQADFPPLDFLHAIFDLARLGRKSKGMLVLTKKGRSLLPEEAAGRLFVALFVATFKRYNLAYLDRRVVKDHFQAQIGLTLYLMSKVAEEPRTADELAGVIISPLENGTSSIRPGAVFQWRVLRYLEWFGLMEKAPSAANDDWASPYLYRKMPLYDRFLLFDLGKRGDAPR